MRVWKAALLFHPQFMMCRPTYPTYHEFEFMV